MRSVTKFSSPSASLHATVRRVGSVDLTSALSSLTKGSGSSPFCHSWENIPHITTEGWL